MSDLDLAIVGAGLAGSAAAWAAAKRGLDVAVFEQFELGHHHGSSHGSARIFRRAYADPFYIELTGTAGELWQKVEAEAGRSLLTMTGGLDFGAERNPGAIAALLGQANIAHELLDATAAGRRWPGIRFDAPVMFHPQAGVIDADAAVRTFLELARAQGTTVNARTAVLGILPAGDHARILTAAGEVTADRVIVAAGAWVASLLDGTVQLPPLEVTQQQIFHFPRRDPEAAWPVFVYKDSLSLYGLPGGRDGGPEAGFKLAEHDGGKVTSPQDRDGVVDPLARERLVEHVSTWFPGLVPEPFNETTCLYTSTADEDFILDRVGPVVVCSPCSGHGAKFAPLIGELAVEVATGTGNAPDRFRLR